ncbi:MAG: DUF1573 domain-containing protein [Bacteroidetes bacterium]|nr:DUF1573 domain-containing protein [Bacteroidota bacterium]
MKRLLSIVTILVFSLGAFAQDNLENAKDTANGPLIKFEKIVHDYGKMYQGADGNADFWFTNTGNEPLILSKPASSCGCTVPTWPKEPLLPGKKETIKVTYNTNGIGVFNKTITVTSNAKNSRVVLTIKGEVMAKPAEVMPEKATEQSAVPINK